MCDRVRSLIIQRQEVSSVSLRLLRCWFYFQNTTCATMTQQQSDRFGTELFIKHYENKILNNVPLCRFFTCRHVRTRSLNKYRNHMYRYTVTALCRTPISSFVSVHLAQSCLNQKSFQEVSGKNLQFEPKKCKINKSYKKEFVDLFLTIISKLAAFKILMTKFRYFMLRLTITSNLLEDFSGCFFLCISFL